MTRRRRPKRPGWVFTLAIVMTVAVVAGVIALLTGYNDCGAARLAMGDAAYVARCAKLPNWDNGVLLMLLVAVPAMWWMMKRGWTP